MKVIRPNQHFSDFFGKLETLTVSGCTNLTNIVQPNMLRTLWNLKELKIYDCDSLEEVFEIQGTNNVEESRDIAATELISLKLRNLEKVKHVWSMDPQGIITFAKLCTVEINRCWSLKSVFPTSVAETLMQLEKLEIKDCAMVEEIVANEEGIETTTLFVFPKLTTLRLHNLPELKSLYPERHTSEWPSLRSLDIQKCNKLKIFGSNKSSMQETNGLGHYASPIQQPLFFIEKVTTSLACVYILLIYNIYTHWIICGWSRLRSGPSGCIQAAHTCLRILAQIDLLYVNCDQNRKFWRS